MDDEEQDPDDIRNVKEGERPVVVVLDEKKDLTEEQVNTLILTHFGYICL